MINTNSMNLAWLLTAALALPTMAAELQPGMQVMPKAGATLKIGTTAVALETVPQPFTIHKIQDDWVWVGTAWTKRSQVIPITDAASYYTELIRNRPASSFAYNSRGIVWETKGELQNAEKDYTEAIRHESDHFAAHNNRGNVRHRIGELDGALKDFSEAIRLRPTSPMAYNNRGLSWRDKGEEENALKDFGEALRLDPKFSPALVNRGNLHRRQGNLTAAIKDFDQAIQVDPYSHEAFNARAWLRATSSDAAFRDGDQAVKDALRACNLTEWQLASHLDTLAAAYAANDDFGRAVMWQTKALELAPAAAREACQQRLELYTAGNVEKR